MRRLGLLVTLTASALSASLLVPGVARAQSLAAGPPIGAKIEGPGIALGERLVLHVGAGAELRYDSNVFYQSSGETSALALRLTPGFQLATRGGSRMAGADGVVSPSKIEFRLGAGLDYREWLVSNTGRRPPRQFNVHANFGLTILPTGPVTIEFYDNYVRSTQPAYSAQDFNYDRNVNEAGIRLRIKPGGGRLELQLGYAFGIDIWETEQQKTYDNFYHRSMIRLLWKFLPKTSVYIQGENIAYQYRNANRDPDRPNGYPLRVIAGLNGLLTPKLTFDLYAGYANGFYQPVTASGTAMPTTTSPNTGIAGLSLQWRPYALGALTLAYRHDFINTLLGVFADLDNVSVSWTQQIWRFGAMLRLAYQNTRYQGIDPSRGLFKDDGSVATDRTDNGFTANARVDYFAYKNWLALSLGYDFNLIRSNTSLGNPGLATATTPVDFNKHEVYLNLSLLF